MRDKIDLLAEQISEMRQDIRDLTHALRQECNEKNGKTEVRVEGLRTDMAALETKVEVNKVKISAIGTMAGFLGSFAQAHMRSILGRL